MRSIELRYFSDLKWPSYPKQPYFRYFVSLFKCS